MGIKKLHDFIRKKNPLLYEPVSVSKYDGFKVAVDILGFIWKYKCIGPNGRWLDQFAGLLLSLKRNNIHPLFVFEGSAPVEKDLEKGKRSEQRDKTREKVSNLRCNLDEYYSSSCPSESLVEEMKKLNIPSIGNRQIIDTIALEKNIERLESQLVSFSEEDYNNIFSLIKLCGMNYISAPGEAETYCAALYHQHIVDAVISNDSDVCAYGVGLFIYDYKPGQDTCVELPYEEVLSALELSSESFLDFCIMCGTDYNKNIQGIGPVNAYKLIKQYKSIDNLPSNYDVSVLNHKRVRELFTPKYTPHNFNIIVTPTNPVEIYNFLKLRNSRIKYETIEKAFAYPEIIFEE